MSEALLLSMIQKLKFCPLISEDQSYEDEDLICDLVYLSQRMTDVKKEMSEIVDIVRDKKLEEGRSLNFLVSDLVDAAEDVFHLVKKWETCDRNYDSIYEWIGEIKKRMLKLGDDESNMRSISENVEDDKYVVGLDEDLEMLIRTRIIGGAGYNSWAGKTMFRERIIGRKGDPKTCGTGKTTLAREIYNHPTVIQYFDRRAWVQDPHNLHTSSLLENMDNRSLQAMLCQHLRGKRYLIVLDNVPKKIYFASFLEALPKNFNGKLLLTSYTMHINIHVDDENVHQMKPLDSDQSWQLFLKTINHGNKLTGGHKFPMSLQPMGKQMLRKCDGLPLAIKEVGKQLVEKKVSGKSEWAQLLESVDFGSVLKLLESFYHKLDPKLESCFMCMAFFKQKITLRKEKLTEIWVAGGVVSRYDCESYLDDLINESVIDVKDKSTEYRMNALLHMLSIQKAEEKLGFEILRNNNGNNRPSESPRQHCVIICSRDKFSYSTDQDKYLVSLFFHGGGYFDTTPSYWKRFELLDILDLEDFGLKIFPETIGRLMELRYLGLRNNYIQELPGSLGCLKKLEVLEMAQNFMVEVPDIIWEMDSLLHLYMSDVICRKPLKVGALQNLKTLTYISVDNWTYELSGLTMLTRLEKLGIEELDGNSDVSKLFVSLADLKNLKHLILRGYRFRSMPCLDELRILQSVRTLKLDGCLARLPRSFPPNIVSLTLVNSYLDEDPMPLLGKLCCLEYLKLRNAYTGQQMVILVGGFPELEVLYIEELWNLRNVQVAESGMIWLTKLLIYDCPYLDTLQEAIGSFSFLNELKMVTTKSIAANIRNSDLISKIRTMNINP
ncbi:probable disease resistance protein At1g58602 [Salvia miltiorrhiza]|uniref:probable disease resistance protein At1g58602 n=1 Tax=Salvia miltiorrhiza TaxID=226208 RepID=UPI0025AD4221|nr:probable disease resistance protein At1g58602 [Salvia miltiorrhiza]